MRKRLSREQARRLARQRGLAVGTWDFDDFVATAATVGVELSSAENLNYSGIGGGGWDSGGSSSYDSGSSSSSSYDSGSSSSGGSYD